MSGKHTDPLTIREKLAIRFMMALIQMIHPWEFSHQYEKYWQEIRDLLEAI